MTKKLLYLFAIALFSQSLTFAQDYALIFDGINSRVKYDDDTTLDNLNGATNYTIELWVKPMSTTIHNKVLLRRWGQFSLTTYQDANKRFYLTINGTSTTYVNTINNALTIGEWNHIVAVCNATDDSIKLYNNGVDVTLGTQTAIPLTTNTSNANFYVGNGGEANSASDVIIDKVRVKTTAEDIASLQTAVTDANYTTDADTVILLNFDEGSGTTTVNDSNSVDANLQCGGGCAEIPVWTLVSDTLSVNNNTLTNFNVYPNPAHDVLNIQTEEAIKNVSIFNVLGKMVYSNNQSSINVANLNSGIYLVKVETANGIGTKKLVIR